MIYGFFVYVSMVIMVDLFYKVIFWCFCCVCCDGVFRVGFVVLSVLICLGMVFCGICFFVYLFFIWNCVEDEYCMGKVRISELRLMINFNVGYCEVVKFVI